MTPTIHQIARAEDIAHVRSLFRHPSGWRRLCARLGDAAGRWFGWRVKR